MTLQKASHLQFFFGKDYLIIQRKYEYFN